MNQLVKLDKQIFFNFYHLTGQNYWRDKVFDFLAQQLIYLVPVILVVLWFWSKEAKNVALKAVTAGLLAWFGFSNLIGYFYYRARPFVTNQNVKELLFHRPDRSFPSDHSAFLFALAFCFLFLGYRKLGLAMILISLLVSASRIIVGVHYPADIAAGLAIGLFSAVIIWFLQKPLDKIYNPLITFAKKLRLA